MNAGLLSPPEDPIHNKTVVNRVLLHLAAGSKIVLMLETKKSQWKPV